jgi:hypothetical protein
MVKLLSLSRAPTEVECTQELDYFLLIKLALSQGTNSFTKSYKIIVLTT